MQYCSVYQIIEKQFVETNRSHENRKQIICDILRPKMLLEELIGCYKWGLKQISRYFYPIIAPRPNRDNPCLWRKHTFLYHIFYKLSESEIPYCFTDILATIDCIEAVLYQKKQKNDPLFPAL